MSAETEQLVSRYEKGVQELEEALRGAPAAILDQKPAPGKWSIREIALHVADAEIVGAARMRTIAAEPGKLLKAYDQDAWAEKLAYSRMEPGAALALFRALRASTAAMLRALPEAAWNNTGLHEETGETTLRKIVPHYAHHAEHHAQQIRELRARFASAARA